MKLLLGVVAVVLVSANVVGVLGFAPNHDYGSRVNTALCVENSRRDMMVRSTAWISGALVASQPAFAAPRPMYLTEPTDEFKESERQRAEFRRAQLVIKGKMQVILDQLSAEPNDEEALVKDLTDLRALVVETGGMPLGIKKDELVKQVRAKKAKGYWPTNVEYAYQGLINEIMFQQSPNKDKDDMNPL